MAWVTSLKMSGTTGKAYPTQVEALVKVFGVSDSRMVVQIDTQGSDTRETPGKQSQTLQFGEEAAKQLFEILKQAFNFK